LYASATRGFKAGGFNNVQNPGYDPEFIWTYEVGAKRDWMQGALRTNLALFSSHYSDLQVTQFISNRAVLSNAAKSNISGFELETILHPASGLNISANVNYLDAKYKKSDPVFSLRDPVTRNFVVMTGKRMPFAPKLAYSIGADYSIPAAFLHGDVNFNATYTWRSAVHLDSLGQPTETQKSFGLLDLRAAWTRADGNVEVAVYARNVTNRVYYQQLLRASALTGGSTGVVGDPRTYGVRVAVKYN
jgi:iron complex outermembrane receptor protein